VRWGKIPHCGAVNESEAAAGSGLSYAELNHLRITGKLTG
jgi:hypothetical protein